MLAKKITSLQHPLVKHWVELRKSRSLREESRTVLLTGEKAIREFSRPIKFLISAQQEKIPAQEHCLVTEEILKKITGLHEPGALAAEVELPPPQDLGEKNSLLILNGLQDPGNLGTLLRTALAFGWEGVAATHGTVDFFNDKALRAAQGATFRLPYAWMDPEQISNWAHRNKAAIWVADVEGDPLGSVPFQPPLALILGSEGQGAGSWAKEIGRPLSIPMQNQVESLNVASAGSIFLYALRNP
jgi:TrmH family RNA methyltransferase